MTEHYLLHFVKEGNGYFRLADRTYRICAGQCFLIYPDQLALYLTDPGKKWEYYWIMLNGTKILSFLETIGFSRENQVISFQGEEVFSHLTGILQSAALKDYFNDDWSVLPEDPQGHFVRALSTDGITKYNDFGKETSWFMPLKQITRPGRRNDAYLDFIREKLGSGIGSPQAPTNIESYTYLPELFFLYDRNAEAWKWMQYILSVKELPHEIAAQGPNGDYPEISFTFLQHVVEGLMGVTPNVPGRTLATLSRLPADIGCVTLEGQEIGQNRITLTHRGRSASVLQNLSGDTLQWTARFPGEYQSILVDRQPLPARIREQCGIAFSEVTVPVEMGREIRAELPV